MEIQASKGSLLDNMNMLHKAKGRWYFNLLLVGCDLTLFLPYFSKIAIVNLLKPKDKNKYYLQLGWGNCSFYVTKLFELIKH